MTDLAIPERCVLLLSGIPATGKSRLARYLSRVHSFAHYDLEYYPRGWPHPELKPTWDSSRTAFVKAVRALHPRIVLDWGFPVGCVPWVRELLDAGARLIWFDGSAPHAREIFIARGGRDIHFDAQVKAIRMEGLPAQLQCHRVVDAFSEAGVLKEPTVLVEEIFGRLNALSN